MHFAVALLENSSVPGLRRSLSKNVSMKQSVMGLQNNNAGFQDRTTGLDRMKGRKQGPESEQEGLQEKCRRNNKDKIQTSKTGNKLA